MKTITWPTNINNKLACSRFVHIDLPPEKMPSPQQLDAARFKIVTADGSHPPVVAQVTAIIPFKIGELSNIHTWPSHGVDSGDFITEKHLQQQRITPETTLAVYYYKKEAS